MKQQYDAPEIKILLLSYTDIVKTSNEVVEPNEDWWAV